MTFIVKSSAFGAGAEIPKQFTCSGEDVSPALEWSGAPAKTAGFALIMEDPDAPVGTWVHWVLWNLPASAHGLPQGAARSEQLFDDARQGTNDFRKLGYNGPCPPPGKPHRYVFTLYALKSDSIEAPPASSPARINPVLSANALAKASFTALYGR